MSRKKVDRDAPYEPPRIRDVLARFGLKGSYLSGDWARGVLFREEALTEFERRAFEMVAAGVSDLERRITFKLVDEEIAQRKAKDENHASDESPSLAESREALRAENAFVHGGSVLHVLEHALRCKTGNEAPARCAITVRPRRGAWAIAPFEEWDLCPLGRELRGRVT